MKTVATRKGGYYYPLTRYSLTRVLSFERFLGYFDRLCKGGVVLDYGAGDRPYEAMLRTKYSDYLAADYEATHSKYCCGKAPDILLTNSRLPLGDASLDCIILTEVLEHVYEPRALLAELYRTLKPEGKLLGTVPFAIQQHDEPFDYHRYTFYCLQKMFQDAGYKIQHLDYIGDLVAVIISNLTAAFEILPKGLAKMRMRWLALPVRLAIGIPAFGYYYAHKMGLDPGAIGYFRRYPLAFSFCLTKE
jgi:SAM-dependent methyltransferase